MKFIRNFSRIILGLVFIFSGFVKGVDPLGFQYKMEDYFVAFHMGFLEPVALPAAIFLIILEVVLGVALLFCLKIKLTAWGTLLLHAYFLILTFFLATFNLVHDCGCFGDFLIMTNIQTFLKNVVLMIFVLIVFFQRRKFKCCLSVKMQYLAIALSALLMFGLSKYCIDHLPIFDFRSWKIGNKIYDPNALQGKVYLTYQNKTSGETQEYPASDYPWDDSAWVAQWEFVSQRIEIPEGAIKNEMTIENEFGDDVSMQYLADPNPVFLFVSYDISKANPKTFEKANHFFEKTYQDGFSFIVLTNGFEDDINEAKKHFNPEIEFFLVDDILLKTIIRANPGLILIQDGVVIDKWHHHDFPAYENVKNQYFKNL